jgi:hypothetical protein
MCSCFDWLISPSAEVAGVLETICDVGLVAATAVVVVGVIGENRKEKGWWQTPGHRHFAEMLVVVGIVAEMLFEAGSFGYAFRVHELDEKTIQTAQTSASAAVLQAARLGVTYKNLKSTVDAQKADVDSAVADLNAMRDKLIAAHDETLASASQTQKALDTVNRTASELTASVTTISGLQKKVHDLTTDRHLTSDQAKALALKLKPIGKVSFDMSANLDLEPTIFAKEIGLAASSAGWDWQPRHTFPGINVPGVPEIGSALDEGMKAEVCSKDAETLKQAAETLKGGLKSAGFTLNDLQTYPDAESDGRKMPCGRLHLIVGSK